VIFQISDHHLPQRGIIINDNDIAAIREHELISQFFLITMLLCLSLNFNR